MLLTLEKIIELNELGICNDKDGKFMYVPKKKLTSKEVKRLLAFDRTHYKSKGRHIRGIEKLAGQRS